MLRHVQRFVTSVSAVLLATHAMCAWSQEIKVVLSGNQEIPPVATSASGTGTITVTADKAVTGSVTITGMSVTVAHIHQAAAGTNGPIVVPLVKTSDTVWAVPPGTRLTDVQYESFKAGILYFNIHSEAYKSGEIRAQIKP
jgi:hypothetical protein